MMLTLEEKETLYSIISNTLGEDITIRNRLTSFTDQTVSVVETMLSENKKMQCQHSNASSRPNRRTRHPTKRMAKKAN